MSWKSSIYSLTSESSFSFFESFFFLSSSFFSVSLLFFDFDLPGFSFFLAVLEADSGSTFSYPSLSESFDTTTDGIIDSDSLLDTNPEPIPAGNSS